MCITREHKVDKPESLIHTSLFEITTVAGLRFLGETKYLGTIDGVSYSRAQIRTHRLHIFP